MKAEQISASVTRPCPETATVASACKSLSLIDSKPAHTNDIGAEASRCQEGQSGSLKSAHVNGILLAVPVLAVIDETPVNGSRGQHCAKAEVDPQVPAESRSHG